MVKKFVIVVSGPPSAGSTTVAKELAKRLNLDYFVPGKIEKKLGKSKKESRASLEAWKTELVRSREFHEDLDKIQIEKAKKGNIVICGKLSIHFLKNLSDYKIWLDVPIKVRVKRAAERDNIPVKEALKEISKRENIERSEWKRIYGFDYFDQKNFADLIIDSSNLTVGQTVNKILKFIRRKK